VTARHSLKEGLIVEKEKGTQLKTILCGVALVALASVPPAQAQTNECTGSGFSGGICNRFDSTHLTNKYQFGDNFIKFTVETLINPFDLNVEFIPITDPELDARVISSLAPVDCIHYVGATSDTNLGTCGFYHVTNPPDSGDYSGDVTVRIFWDFPTLAILHNVRLYRAPLDGVPPDGTCGQGFDCYTQDITDAVFAVGDSNTVDPGVGGKSKGFSDFEAVDLTSPTSPAARVWIGLKDNSGGKKNVRFDLKAEVVSDTDPPVIGELLGALGGGPGFGNANLLTIPLSLPTGAFDSGSVVSMELSVRSSCLGSSDNSGTARLWFNDAKANSRVDGSGVPTTLYLVMPGSTLNLSLSAGKGKKTRDAFVDAPPDPTCNGPYTSFGTWTGLVP
jgi:hypothetical protein